MFADLAHTAVPHKQNDDLFSPTSYLHDKIVSADSVYTSFRLYFKATRWIPPESDNIQNLELMLFHVGRVLDTLA